MLKSHSLSGKLKYSKRERKLYGSLLVVVDELAKIYFFSQNSASKKYNSRSSITVHGSDYVLKSIFRRLA